ncbi:MAG: LuxR C-terminal-related transcriptional regulator [Pseudomonadota bacterium]
MSNRPDLERVLVFAALAAVAGATVFDLYDDWSDGGTTLELLMDLVISAFIASTLVYIWMQRPSATRARNRHLERVVKHSNNDLVMWKKRASRLLQGLGTEIDQQFEHWNLSKAEKEVALLLIKGISIKELAQFRGTSEKTVRQQASNIYAKANLENRAELAAFFLEDLLLPPG